MNKLTIGFIILIVIALIIFSYYSYTETFTMGGVTNPCLNLEDSQCRANDSCSVISDSGCFLRGDQRCESIDPEVTRSSGGLQCSQNGCGIVKNRSECDGLSLQECNNNMNCFSFRDGEDLRCFHQTEDYRQSYIGIENKLSTNPGESNNFDCYQNPSSDTQADFDRYCINVSMGGDSSHPPSPVMKQMICSTPRMNTGGYESSSVSAEDIQNYSGSCQDLTYDNVKQCMCYPIDLSPEDNNTARFLAKGIFAGLPLFDVQIKLSALSCRALNNIKTYINSLTESELNEFNEDLQFTTEQGGGMPENGAGTPENGPGTPENGPGMPETFSELVDYVIDMKCINSCINICENYDETQCGQNTDICSWDSNYSRCKRSAEANCNAKERDDCRRDATCRFENSYSFCGANIANCSPGQETVVDKNNIARCQNCREGYFGRDGLECNRCHIVNANNQRFTPPISEYQIDYDDNYFRQTSVPGATACVNRSEVCNENQFETVNIPDGALQILDQEFANDENLDVNFFKHKLSNYKNTNRNCSNLVRCGNSQFVTNYGEDKLEITSPSSSDENIILNYGQFDCTDLDVCDINSEYVSNYNSMEQNKASTGNMYSSNRECNQLTNCEPGKFVERTIQVEDDQNVSNRLCSECDVNTYTDNQNMRECIDQPICNMGQKVNAEFNDGSDGVIKTARLTCETCEDYKYSDTQSRNFNCQNQTPCQPGFYYPEENQERSQTYQVQCRECPCDHYQDQSNTFETSCNQQPIINEAGYGVTEEYPSCNNQDVLFKSSSIVVEECNGDENYQDNEGPHREQCKDHITCNRGELISPIDPIQTRSCSDIERYELRSCDNNRCQKKAKQQHRDVNADLHPNCTDSTILQVFDENNYPRLEMDNLPKYDGSCITTSQRLLLCDQLGIPTCPV